MILSQDLFEETEENGEIFSQDSRCTDRDSIRAPLEYKSKALPLCVPARVRFVPGPLT
jgi:hypothetical protein